MAVAEGGFSDVPERLGAVDHVGGSGLGGLGFFGCGGCAVLCLYGGGGGDGLVRGDRHASGAGGFDGGCARDASGRGQDHADEDGGDVLLETQYAGQLHGFAVANLYGCLNDQGDDEGDPANPGDDGDEDLQQEGEGSVDGGDDATDHIEGCEGVAGDSNQ